LFFIATSCPIRGIYQGKTAVSSCIWMDFTDYTKIGIAKEKGLRKDADRTRYLRPFLISPTKTCAIKTES
jgi:hypothetical protein